MTSEEKQVIELAVKYGQINGEHHKMWVIDQIIRIIAAPDGAYEEIIREAKAGEDGPETYDWDVGIPP